MILLVILDLCFGNLSYFLINDYVESNYLPCIADLKDKFIITRFIGFNFKINYKIYYFQSMITDMF